MTRSSVNATLLLNATPITNHPIGYPKVNQERPSNGNQIGAPRTNQDFVCLLWGEAEVRVAFNDRAERYHSRNLVTERDVIGLYDLIVEREIPHNR